MAHLADLEPPRALLARDAHPPDASSSRASACARRRHSCAAAAGGQGGGGCTVWARLAAPEHSEAKRRITTRHSACLRTHAH